MISQLEDIKRPTNKPLTNSLNIKLKRYLHRVPILCGFRDLNKIVLHKILVSGTILNAQLIQKSPMYSYIS